MLKNIPSECGNFSNPTGGYFITYKTTKPIATKVVELCKNAGVLITPAGATFPYGYDPNDSFIRIAPTFVEAEELQKAIDAINKAKFKIVDVNTKLYRRNPLAPFTTSTLQQTASGRFGFGASRTMQIAQRLYQGVDIEGETTGLITYMRTDGTNISKEAIEDFRTVSYTHLTLPTSDLV